MRHIFLAILLIFTIFGCTKNENEMHLSGNVKGLTKGTLLLLKIKDSSLIAIDSQFIKGNSNFKFTEVVSSPEIYFLKIKIKDGTLLDERVPFFAEAGQMTLNTSLRRFAVDAKITGSKNQEKLEEYRKIMQRYTDENLNLIAQKFTASQNNNDSLSQAIEIKLKSLYAKSYFATVNFAMNNKEYELAPYLMLTEANKGFTKYMDTVYNVLSSIIKNSNYGKQLESIIKLQEI